MNYDSGLVRFAGIEAVVDTVPFVVVLPDMVGLRTNTIQIFVNGLIQPYGTYSITDQTLVLNADSGVVVGDSIRVTYAL
jgi:hypothetical protein